MSKGKGAPEILGTLYVVCRDCGEQFTIEPREQEWLRSRGLELFSRCRECRQRRKEKRAREAAFAPPGEKRRPW